MAEIDIKSDHFFIGDNADLFSHIANLEQQFLSHCTEITDKNKELRERNRELLASAEIGITAEAELKKMRISTSALNDEIQQLNDEISDLNYKLEQADLVYKNLQKESDERQRRAIGELQSICDGQKEQIESRTQELQEALVEMMKLESEKMLTVERLKASYESETTDLKNELEAKIKSLTEELEKERDSKRQAVGDTHKAFESQLSDLAFASYENETQLSLLKSELTQKEQVIESLTALLDSEKTNSEKLKTAFDQQLSEMAKSGLLTESKVGQLTAQIGEASRAAQAANAIIAEKERKVNSLQHEVAILKRTISDLEKMAVQYRAEIHSQKTIFDQHMTLISNLTQGSEVKDKTIQSLKETNWNDQIEIKKLKELHNSQIRSALTGLNEKIEEKNKSLVESARENAEMKERLKASEQNQDSLRKTIAELSNRDQAESKKLAELGLQLRHREVQLRHYASNVAKEKNEVIQCARQLADEIRSARTLSPLKDYLSLTEFEMSKTELQLKKTPTISLERARLESVLTQLHEQREFLKKAIAKSRSQLEEQAANLLKIARRQKAGTIPPLPPETRDLDLE